MSALRPFHPRWRALGWPALAGLLALALAAVLALGLTPYWHAQQQALSEQQRTTRQWQAEQARALRATAAQAPAAWPLAAANDARVAALVELALHHGVTLTGTEQPLQLQAAGSVAWQLLNMPARASYADLRGFIAAALQADPALALDALRLRRENAQAEQVDAELRWALGQAAAPAVPAEPGLPGLPGAAQRPETAPRP